MRRQSAAGLATAALFAAVLPVAAAVVGPPVALRLAGGAHMSVPGSSMAPTLVPGDVILGWPVPPGGPRRGDVVVYRHADAPYLGRIAGLAGERLRLVGGIVEIDGRPARMRRLDDRVREIAPGTGRARCREGTVEAGRCTEERWREVLPGGAGHVVLNVAGTIGEAAGGAPFDDTPPVTVPAGHVFVLGDHRDNAVDSRHPVRGPVPLAAVEAVVLRLHYSTAPGRRFAGIFGTID